MVRRSRKKALRGSEALDVTGFGMTGLLSRAGLAAIFVLVIFLMYALATA